MKIEAKQIRKTYKVTNHVVNVLEDASLDVPSGKSLAIVGASGAGKSTLLHILGGLDEPDTGSVTLGDCNLYSVSSMRRTKIRAANIGFVFQSYHLMPELTVLENTYLPGMTGAMPGVPLAERGTELLTSVGLAERAHHLPMELSGGEQQRVALARALMNKPEIILADEPTGNLDAETGKQVLDYVFGLAREYNSTLVMVTHDEQLAQRCNRVMRLDSGRLVSA